MDNNMEDIIKQDIENQMRIHLKECFNYYGIEGTEQKIKEVYKLMPVTKQKYLELYNKILKGE